MGVKTGPDDVWGNGECDAWTLRSLVPCGPIVTKEGIRVASGNTWGENGCGTADTRDGGISMRGIRGIYSMLYKVLLFRVGGIHIGVKELVGNVDSIGIPSGPKCE
jgi:hypothetical protein